MTEHLQTLFISGMACLGCAGEIKYALEKNPSISVRKVNLERRFSNYCNKDRFIN